MSILKKNILLLKDVIQTPIVYVAAHLLRHLRQFGIDRSPLCKSILMNVGVFPILNHYYEPQFDGRMLSLTTRGESCIPGVDFNRDEQLSLLRNLSFSEELIHNKSFFINDIAFSIDNGNFESGDAEYWYNFIRFKKPSKIIEIGSGYSTLLARMAINKNIEEMDYKCEHICIEPYEMPWLEASGVNVIRKKAEDMGSEFFSILGENDILFIDSSHIIRPQGDVLFTILKLLPTLSSGVIVHFHDIFSPRDYPREWLVDFVRFWNEQYLLEAFLSCNASWKIIGAINYLFHNNYDELKGICHFLTKDREPGSFYIQKVNKIS